VLGVIRDMVAPAQLRPGDLLTVAQVLKIMPVGKSTLYALCDSGQLPCYRVRSAASRRGRILIARRDLETYLAGARHTATRAPVRLDVDGILAGLRRGK
jgi:excisionase family DNA binding protein